MVLTELGVSRRHVRLFTRGGRLHVEDPGHHRTLLNDQPLTEPREVKSGDLLALGPVVLKVEPLAPREAPPIDRGETRVAPPDPGEAPDLHRQPTAPAQGGRSGQKTVPIDRAPTAPLPSPIDREPTDPLQATEAAEPAPAPVLPPLPSSLIARLQQEANALSRSETPLEEGALTPHDAPIFEGRIGAPPLPPPRASLADGAAGRAPAPRAMGEPGPVRGSGVKAALGEPGAPRASGSKSALGEAGAPRASGSRSALGEAGAPRSSGQKARLSAEPTPRASGPKVALGTAGSPRGSGARSALPNVLDDSLRPTAYPQEEPATQVRSQPPSGRRRGWDPRYLAAGVAAVAAVLLLVLAVRWIARADPRADGPEVLADQPLEGSFGAGPGVSWPVADWKRLRLEVSPQPREVVVLHFLAESVSEGELELRLNGTALPFRLEESGLPGAEVERVLPREVLKADGTNALEFRRVPGAQEDAHWRLTRPWLERVALPAVEESTLLETALKYAARGREHLDRSAAGPDSLFQAWRAYRLAWLTVEPVRPPHPLSAEAHAKYEAIGQSLDQRCLALVSAAERSLRERDAKGARDSLDQVSRYFPSGEHRCHNLAVELLKQHGL